MVLGLEPRSPQPCFKVTGYRNCCLHTELSSDYSLNSHLFEGETSALACFLQGSWTVVVILGGQLIWRQDQNQGASTVWNKAGIILVYIQLPCFNPGIPFEVILIAMSRCLDIELIDHSASGCLHHKNSEKTQKQPLNREQKVSTTLKWAGEDTSLASVCYWYLDSFDIMNKRLPFTFPLEFRALWAEL